MENEIESKHIYDSITKHMISEGGGRNFYSENIFCKI